MQHFSFLPVKPIFLCPILAKNACRFESWLGMTQSSFPKLPFCAWLFPRGVTFLEKKPGGDTSTQKKDTHSSHQTVYDRLAGTWDGQKHAQTIACKCTRTPRCRNLKL